MRILISFFVVCSILVSCVEPFDLGDALENKAGTPVINGWISNFPHDYRINVSHTVAINDTTRVKPVPDAKVVLKNGSGESFETFYDSREKNYSLPNLFSGIEGETYWVEATFPDGSVFQSSPELLQSAVPISNLTFGKDLGYSDWLDANVREVIVNFDDPPFKRNYYLWLTENLGHSPINADSRLYAIEDDLFFDGQTRSVFVTQVGGIFDSGGTFPILVRQLSVSRTGYKFFDLINQINQGQQFNSEGDSPIDPISNGLFAKPPISLEGNIFEKGNPSNFGAGYFGVYGHSSMPLLAQAHRFALELNPIFEYTCEIRLSNGVITSEPGFEDCISFPQTEGTKEGNWNSYVFQEDLDSRYEEVYFSGNSKKVTLRSSSVHVKLESRFKDGSLTRENLYLLVEDGFSGRVDLEIEATNFLTTVAARYILNVD